jgi:predicted ester cyclase
MQGDPAKIREFALGYTAAWCSQNAASVAAFYSPGGSLTINNGTPAIGRNEITESAQSFMAAFPDLQVLVDEVIVHAHSLEYRWTLIGTNTGPAGTGHRVRICGSELWQIGTDGLISSSLGHFDTSDYLRQLEGGVQETR